MVFTSNIPLIQDKRADGKTHYLYPCMKIQTAVPQTPESNTYHVRLHYGANEIAGNE